MGKYCSERRRPLIEAALVATLIPIFYIIVTKHYVVVEFFTSSGSTNLESESLGEISMDYRNNGCLKSLVSIEPGSLRPVSILLVFNNIEFYDLKPTIESVLLNTPSQLIGEILIVDDGSKSPAVIRDSEEFVRRTSGARLLRRPFQTGLAIARNFAVAQATFDPLVFVAPGAICAKGWLEPLIRQVKDEPSSLAVPHLDSLLRRNRITYKYEPVHDSLVTTFGWSLAVRTVKIAALESVKRYSSPVARAEVFVVRKRFFHTIGGYDEDFRDLGEGEQLELSLRTWLCGGTIRVVPCSRVALRNLSAPVRATSRTNLARVACLWLRPANYKEAVFRSLNFDPKTTPCPADAAREHDREQLKCRGMDWFVQYHFPDLMTALPSTNASYFGLLTAKSGACAKLAERDRVEMVSCTMKRFEDYPPGMLLELTIDGRLTVAHEGGERWCLTTKGTAYIEAEECRSGDNHQRYRYDVSSSKEITNDWTGFCLMQVTDPRPEARLRQILMAQNCSSDKSGLFISWTFNVV